MFVRLAAALVVATLMLGSSTANASMFGKDETVHYLQDINITSQNKEALFLGYKTSTLFVVAGVSITDDGYVFGLRSDHSKYIETSPEEIAIFQKSGLLPDPLPPYKISTFEYLVGYSLWIVLPFIATFYLIAWRRKRKTA